MKKATQKLHDLGQSIWLDNISRALLTTGTLERYAKEWSVTGPTFLFDFSRHQEGHMLQEWA
jgi:transaldolase